MASAYRKRGTWYASYKTSTGDWHSIATTATTKTDAKRIATELEAKAERRRLGLEPLITDCKMTLKELCKWWLKHRCPDPSIDKEESRLTRHIFETSLGNVMVPHVTTARLEDRF